MYEAKPALSCCILETILIKLPRFLGSTVAVTMACAGINLPLLTAKNTEVAINAIQISTLGMCVINNTGIQDMLTKMVNTFSLPILSASLPISGDVTMVLNPPKK